MPDGPELVLGEWHIVAEPNGTTTIYTSDDSPIATVHGGVDEKLRRAFLIARAPTLRDATRAALQLFRLMLDHPDERVAGSAQDMIPALESALYMTGPE